MHSLHANAFYHSAFDGYVWIIYRILVNLTSGGSQPLGGIPINLYLSISTVTVPSWCGFLSWCVEYVSSKCYCHAEVFCSRHANCGAIAVIASMTYMTIVELFDEYPAPFSPEMTMIRTPTSIMNDKISSMKPERSILLRGVSPTPGPSSPPSSFYNMVIKKPNTRT